MTKPPSGTNPDTTGPSLVVGDPPYRLQRAAGLISARGLNVGRRAALLAAVTWLPVAVWAAVQGRALPGAVAEPLFEHLGIHVRLLVALPALVIGEALAHTVSAELIPYFRTSGVVAERDAKRFDEIVGDMVRLRNHLVPWLTICGVVAVITVVTARPAELHEVIWAAGTPPDRTTLGFGGVWLLYVARPIFLFFLLSGVWRVILAMVVMRRVAKLDLDLVPTHSDRAGGLGFLEDFPAAFACFAFAVSSVLASHSAHEVLYHEVTLRSLAPMAALLLACVVATGLAPLAAFLPPLSRAKKKARLDYATLVAAHGRLVRHRWILGESIPRDEVLEAPELGPVADVCTLYDRVAEMRVVPIGTRALALVAVPAMVPMLGVVLLQVPLKELVLKILSILA